MTRKGPKWRVKLLIRLMLRACHMWTSLVSRLNHAENDGKDAKESKIGASEKKKKVEETLNTALAADASVRESLCETVTL